MVVRVAGSVGEVLGSIPGPVALSRFRFYVSLIRVLFVSFCVLFVFLFSWFCALLLRGFLRGFCVASAWFLPGFLRGLRALCLFFRLLRAAGVYHSRSPCFAEKGGAQFQLSEAPLV